MTLDLVQTVAFAGLVLFAGYWVKRRVPILSRYNIPAPVVGGLPVAAILALLYAAGRQPLAFDTALQTPLQNTFFASVGFGASVRLLRRGGPLVAVMMLVATIAAALQNVLGAVVAMGLGEHPLFGVLAGSVTLSAAASMAKAYSSDAGWRVCSSSLQVHGGIGFTWEHDLHFYLKRAKTNAMLFGSAREHRERVAELSLATESATAAA